MQTQIQVRVNEEGALRNQRFAFTDRYTLITELLQNARRAGADRIEVAFDAATQVLRVTDNGRGVEDFQKLLVFNESGWDDATRQHEHPFGVGFSKCLYSATRCIVRSGDRFIDFQTDDALARKPIDVHLDTRGPIGGTQVELHGVDLPDLGERMNRLCTGFPVEVTYNGQALDRHYAEDRMDFFHSAIGTMHLAGLASGNHATTTLAFLQGFKVLPPRCYSPGHVNVVHLDPERFMARLPDRDKLIDESDQERVIDAEIRQQWRAVLETAKSRLPPRQFVDRYFDAIRSFDHLDLLNDLDALPRGVCSMICDYPHMGIDASTDYLDGRIEPPIRQHIDDGSVVVVDLDEVHEENTAHWMFARGKGFLVCNPDMLHEAHWLHGKIRKLSTEMIGLAPVGTPQHAHFSGIWVAAALTLCDAIQLRVGDDTVDIGKDAVFHGGTIFVPAGESSGFVVCQVSNYIDEHDDFREYEQATDMDSLADLIRRLRSVDPQDTLISLLQPLHLEKYPVLHGKTFRVCVDGKAEAPSIALIE